MNCWSHRPRSSRTSHSIDKPLFIRWWPGLFVFTIWFATELKNKYLGEGSHLDPPNIYTMVTPLIASIYIYCIYRIQLLQAFYQWWSVRSSFTSLLYLSKFFKYMYFTGLVLFWVTSRAPRRRTYYFQWTCSIGFANCNTWFIHELEMIQLQLFSSRQLSDSNDPFRATHARSYSPLL